MQIFIPILQPPNCPQQNYGMGGYGGGQQTQQPQYGPTYGPPQSNVIFPAGTLPPSPQTYIGAGVIILNNY